MLATRSKSADYQLGDLQSSTRCPHSVDSSLENGTGARDTTHAGPHKALQCKILYDGFGQIAPGRQDVCNPGGGRLASAYGAYKPDFGAPK